jgi:2,3-bisphosphoglycerate-dependent phosphoglycerate mutase
MYKIVLIRHGESQWNLENRFSGWVDVDLSKVGVSQAKEAGKLLKKEGYAFDVVFSSVLKRANRTAELLLKELGQNIALTKTWKLNERHYGALQGLNKAETAAKYGDEQVLLWRRSYDVLPPLYAITDKNHPSHDPLYANIDPKVLPGGENLKITVERVVEFWHSDIVPAIKSEKRVLIAAHGNSLRGLVMYLDKMTQEEIMKLNIPTGVPLVYELDKNLKPIKHYYLGDAEEIAAKQAAVANQGKAKKK